MRNIIIIGSGPAGYTAALYAGRASLAPLLFEGDQVGGQLMTTTEVENYPGFPKGILGSELMAAMREQAVRFGAEIVSAHVTAVDLSSSPFTVTAGERIEQSKTVIISTGASAKRLGLDSEKALFGRGVSACATCDAYFFKGKKVVVVGGGDAAMEEALFLSRFADVVTMLVRSNALKASKIMQDRAKADPKISFIWNVEVTEVLGVDVGRVTGVRLADTVTGEARDLATDGMFVAIGHTPNVELFFAKGGPASGGGGKGVLDLDQRGYLKTAPGTTATNIPGVFASGDVQDWRYRQAVTAAGTGCMAALDAQRFLEEQKG